MSILLHTDRNPERWVDGFAAALPDHELVVWPNIGDANDVEYLVVWKHDWADLVNYPNLRAILLVSAGIDHLDFAAVPAEMPVVRLVDPEMSLDIAEYCTHWVTHFSRGFDAYRNAQTTRSWNPIARGERETVGILGFGAIGTVVAERLDALGHPVVSWSRSPKDTTFGDHFIGADALAEFLGRCDVVVNLLPLSDATRNLIADEAFAAIGHGVFINAGRGATVDAEALLRALDGDLRGAVLDVFAAEPLPANSPLWAHPKVVVTPHVAGETNPTTATAIIGENILRIERGEEPTPQVNASTY